MGNTLRHTRGVRRFLSPALLMAVVGCNPSSDIDVSSDEPSLSSKNEGNRTLPLALNVDDRRKILQNPRLKSKLKSSAYAYFRFQHESFTERICQFFSKQRHYLPLVNLHGDAHLEQYAITDSAYGIDDFDEAGFGPAVVDLVRFGASIHLACQDASFDCDPKAAIDRFVDRYLHAVIDPETPHTAPEVAQRLREEQERTPARYLDWAEGLMLEIPDASADHIKRAWGELVDMLRTTNPDRPKTFYRPRRIGGLDLGIGSALATKYLVRIEGPTDALEDDRIVEIKQQDLTDRTGCVYHPPTGGVLYPQVMQVRLGRVRPEVLAYLPHPGLTAQAEQQRVSWMYWVRSWDVEYRELKTSDILTQRDLNQVAEDVGLQLGQGHCRYVTAPLEAQHRFAHHRSVEGSKAEISRASRILAAELTAAWRVERSHLN